MQTRHEQTVFKRSVDEYPWSADLTAWPAVQYTYTDAIIRTGRDRMSLWLYSQHPLINVTETVKLGVPVQWPELCKDAQLFTLLLIICVHVCLCILCRVFYCAVSGRLVLLINWLIDWLIDSFHQPANSRNLFRMPACYVIPQFCPSVRPSVCRTVHLNDSSRSHWQVFVGRFLLLCCDFVPFCTVCRTRRICTVSARRQWSCKCSATVRLCASGLTEIK